MMGKPPFDIQLQVRNKSLVLEGFNNTKFPHLKGSRGSISSIGSKSFQVEDSLLNNTIGFGVKHGPSGTS